MTAARATRKFAPVKSTCDPNREREFAALLKPHHCTLKLSRTSYWPYWTVEDKAGDRRSTGFDCDIPRIAQFLANGVPLSSIDLYDFGGKTQVRTETRSKSANAGICAVCGEPGGLPCPKMVALAQSFKIRLEGLEKSPDDNTHVHPGRCRARLKMWIEAGQKQKAGRV